MIITLKLLNRQQVYIMKHEEAFFTWTDIFYKQVSQATCNLFSVRSGLGNNMQLFSGLIVIFSYFLINIKFLEEKKKALWLQLHFHHSYKPNDLNWTC